MRGVRTAASSVKIVSRIGVHGGSALGLYLSSSPASRSTSSNAWFAPWPRCCARVSNVGRDGDGEGGVDPTDEKAGPAFEGASESSPVEYWVSLSPKTARKQARREPTDRASDGKDEQDEGDEKRDEEGRLQLDELDELDEEFLSSSADEAKWEEYYQNGGNDDVGSIISDPARATTLEQRWMAGMSEGKDPVVVRRFER